MTEGLITPTIFPWSCPTCRTASDRNARERPPSWTCPNVVCRAFVWQQDGSTSTCTTCGDGLRVGRRHHCRLCGHLMCDRCRNDISAVLPEWKTEVKQKVCRSCLPVAAFAPETQVTYRAALRAVEPTKLSGSFFIYGPFLVCVWDDVKRSQIAAASRNAAAIGTACVWTLDAAEVGGMSGSDTDFYVRRDERMGYERCVFRAPSLDARTAWMRALRRATSKRHEGSAQEDPVPSHHSVGRHSTLDEDSDRADDALEDSAAPGIDTCKWKPMAKWRRSGPFTMERCVQGDVDMHQAADAGQRVRFTYPTTTTCVSVLHQLDVSQSAETTKKAAEMAVARAKRIAHACAACPFIRAHFGVWQSDAELQEVVARCGGGSFRQLRARFRTLHAVLGHDSPARSLVNAFDENCDADRDMLDAASLRLFAAMLIDAVATLHEAGVTLLRLGPDSLLVNSLGFLSLSVSALVRDPPSHDDGKRRKDMSPDPGSMLWCPADFVPEPYVKKNEPQLPPESHDWYAVGCLLFWMAHPHGATLSLPGSRALGDTQGRANTVATPRWRTDRNGDIASDVTGDDCVHALPALAGGNDFVDLVVKLAAASPTERAAAGAAARSHALFSGVDFEELRRRAVCSLGELADCEASKHIPAKGRTRTAAAAVLPPASPAPKLSRDEYRPSLETALFASASCNDRIERATHAAAFHEAHCSVDPRAFVRFATQQAVKQPVTVHRECSETTGSSGDGDDHSQSVLRASGGTCDSFAGLVLQL